MISPLRQIGVAIRLLDQRSVQEQLYRTEKLAAVGRLISGVVNELQMPLASITDLAHKALEQQILQEFEIGVNAHSDQLKLIGRDAVLARVPEATRKSRYPESIPLSNRPKLPPVTLMSGSAAGRRRSGNSLKSG